MDWLLLILLNTRIKAVDNKISDVSGLAKKMTLKLDKLRRKKKHVTNARIIIKKRNSQQI